MAAVTEGNGWSISAGSSTFNANIISASGLEAARESIETSHLGTSSHKTFIPAKLVDNGELSMTIQFDADFDFDTIMHADAETWTITWPLPAGQSSEATWAFSGFMTGYGGVTVENDSLQTADVTLKITGDITVTASA